MIVAEIHLGTNATKRFCGRLKVYKIIFTLLILI